MQSAAINPNEAQCLSAAHTQYPQSVTSGRQGLVAGNWDWVPPGGSVQTPLNNGDWAVHYNRGGGCGSRECSTQYSPVG